MSQGNTHPVVISNESMGPTNPAGARPGVPDKPAPEPMVIRELGVESPEAEPATHKWTAHKAAGVIAALVAALAIVAAIMGYFMGWIVAIVAFVLYIVLMAVNPLTWAALVRGQEHDEVAGRVASRRRRWFGF